MPTWSAGIPLKGAPGLSVLSGTAAPSDAIGVDGQTYINTATGQLYRKAGGTWGAPISLVGPKGDTGAQGGAADVPSNITANSVTVAPVANDAKASTLTVKNGSATTVYNVDGSGNVTGAGNASVGGALAVSASVTGNGFATTATGGASSPAFGITGAFRGTQNALVSSGTYFNSQYGQMYEVVGGFTSRSQTFTAGNPVDLGPGYITHNWATLVTGGNTAFRFNCGEGLGLLLYGSGAALFGASVAVTGLTTTAGLKLSSGALTFADGTSLTTAPAAVNAGSADAFKAQALGTAASPAFAYKATGAGTYFDANGNVLVAVNGFKSLYSDAASGAAAGASGWAIASSRGAGAMVLSLFGNGGTTATTTVDGAGALTTAGLVKSAGVTLTSGALTFADGTSFTTASANAGAKGDPGSQMRYGMGPPTTTNPATQLDGDSYIQVDQSLLWGPRTGGTWPATPVNLKGPTGPAGIVMRSMVFAGSYWMTNFAANQVQQLQDVVYSNPSVGYTPHVLPMTRAGSVVGWSLNQVGPIGGNIGIAIYKNNAVLYSNTNVGTGVAAFTGVFSAGTYPYAAGDVLYLAVSCTASGNLQCMGHLEVQSNT